MNDLAGASTLACTALFIVMVFQSPCASHVSKNCASWHRTCYDRRSAAFRGSGAFLQAKRPLYVHSGSSVAALDTPNIAVGRPGDRAYTHRSWTSSAVLCLGTIRAILEIVSAHCRSEHSGGRRSTLCSNCCFSPQPKQQRWERHEHEQRVNPRICHPPAEQTWGVYYASCGR